MACDFRTVTCETDVAGMTAVVGGFGLTERIGSTVWTTFAIGCRYGLIFSDSLTPLGKGPEQLPQNLHALSRSEAVVRASAGRRGG